MNNDHKSTIGDLNILIIDDVHELLPKGLSEVGANVLYLPNANREEVLKALPGKQVLVVRTKINVDEEVFKIGSDLKYIARAGAGLDNIDLQEAERKGIICFNAGEANSDAVGEQTLGMLLMLFNNLARANEEVKQGIWKREANRGIELAGKTVAIIGYGNTGAAFAKKLSGMGVQVLAYDKYKRGFGTHQVVESNWEEIYQKADVLSFHVPLTEETKYYFDKEKVERFKKEFYLLNLSRGKVVKTEDLVEALKNGRVKGAALDVLENEDLKSLNREQKSLFEYLCKSEKVILSPHIGGWTKESYYKISKVILDKLLTFRPKL
jgi:D-3-phosphoglycerate dehydrogenase / 2-oxoglutarate reductase